MYFFERKYLIQTSMKFVPRVDNKWALVQAIIFTNDFIAHWHTYVSQGLISHKTIEAQATFDEY